MTTTNQLQEINAVTLKKWLDQKEALLIDVREPGEYAAEHIAGAKLISLSQFDSTVIPHDSNQKIVFVGAGLVFAGVTNTCAMAILLAKLPYNQRAVNAGDMVL